MIETRRPGRHAKRPGPMGCQGIDARVQIQHRTAPVGALAIVVAVSSAKLPDSSYWVNWRSIGEIVAALILPPTENRFS
jgi:hypothetical protein